MYLLLRESVSREKVSRERKYLEHIIYRILLHVIGCVKCITYFKTLCTSLVYNSVKHL